ncbi:hypothetical protein [Pontibacter actiniarum]|uniref:Lantibiotic ABC transporter permease n=1 Tax=Pontibacter actiniarum TaxID=323450 RepID=A0A1X9YP37_9BACT|nr:hypothetical protein [Pontibacter actiniarum]ARS34629.1 hypothetical protein CA264_03735 [Pontibacter actiniarum]
MKNIKTLAVLNTLFFLVHLVPSQLTQFGVFNSQTIGDVSAQYPALFTPAGITFSIWGVIYLGLSIFCIYHLIKAFKASPEHEANIDLQRLGNLFMVNNLATGLWTIAWVNEWLVISVLLILTQLVTLLLIHLRLNIFNAARSAASRWFTQVPLSLYFGWIIIATVANISSALVGLGWDGFGLSEGLWTTIMIVAATLIVVFVVFARSNPYVGLVGVWALYGIILKHRDLNAEASSQIITTAWIGLAVVALAAILIFFRNASSSRQSVAPISSKA